MKHFLALAVLAVATGVVLGQGKNPLTPDEQKQIQNFQRQFQQCRANAGKLTPEQTVQCKSVQNELKKFQNLVAERTGQVPDGADDAEIEAELNVRLDPELTLLKVTPQVLNAFLKSDRAVGELVNCFETFKKCKHRAGTSLVNDVLKLSRGLRCATCSKEEQAKLRAVVQRSITGLQNHHPQQWKRLLPHIGFLL